MSEPTNDLQTVCFTVVELCLEATIPEESTSSDMRSDIPAIQVLNNPKKDFDVSILPSPKSQTIHIYSRTSSKATRFSNVS